MEQSEIECVDAAVGLDVNSDLPFFVGVINGEEPTAFNSCIGVGAVVFSLAFE
jgi:hypothetical protein